MSDRFAELGKEHPILVCGVVVGDPDVESTVKNALTLLSAGVDVLELLVPVPDATFHGPVIRRAFDRALKHGVTMEQAMWVAASIRNEHNAPLIISSYYNRFVNRSGVAGELAGAGVDGVMVHDLPFEESAPFRQQLEAENLALIASVTPSTSPARAEAIASVARGLVFNSMHVGGEVSQDAGGVTDVKFPVPVVASMQISDVEDAQRAILHADGIVFSSAVCWLIEGQGDDVEARLSDFVVGIRNGIVP